MWWVCSSGSAELVLAILAAGCSGVGVGFVSALVPVVNAEAAALAVAVSSTSRTVVTVALALPLGQTCGKLVIFEGARRGIRGRWQARLAYQPRHRTSRARAWQERAVALLASRRRGSAVVLASASRGLPPLLLVSAVAGAASGRRRDFALCCLVGRSARFLTAGLGVVAAVPGLHF